MCDLGQQNWKSGPDGGESWGQRSRCPITVIFPLLFMYYVLLATDDCSEVTDFDSDIEMT